MDTAAAQASLDAIDAILNSGVSSVTVDGRTTNYDLEQLRITAERLRRQIATGGTAGKMRNVIYNSAYSR